MNRNSLSILFQLIQLLFLTDDIYSFEVINCTSNKIHVIKTDKNTGKVTIKYDESSSIQFPYNGPPVELWCEANDAIDKCQLTHNNEKKSVEANCTYFPKNTLDSNEFCANEKRIQFLNYSSKICRFSLSHLDEKDCGIMNISLHSERQLFEHRMSWEEKENQSDDYLFNYLHLKRENWINDTRQQLSNGKIVNKTIWYPRHSHTEDFVNTTWFLFRASYRTIYGWGYSTSIESCYDPVCKHLSMYKGGEDDGNVEGCSHYYYRQSSHDQDIEKYNWNYCHLVSFDYDLGYKTASVYDDDYDRFENHTVGIAKCHEHRAPWCDGCNYESNSTIRGNEEVKDATIMNSIYIIVTGCSLVAVVVLVVLAIVFTKNKKNKDKHKAPTRKTTLDETELASKTLLKDDDFGPNKEDFKKIEERDSQRCKDTSNYQGRRHNKSGKKLNLHDDVLPFDFNRVILKNPISKADYVNASWVSKAVSERYDSLDFVSYPSYSKINFIVTQRPYRQTFPHFYQMVHENTVDAIISINDHQDRALETSDVIETFGSTTVIVKKRYNIHERVVKSELELQNKISTARFSQIIDAYEFNEWNDQKPHGTNLHQTELGKFMKFFCLVRKELSNKKDEITIVVQDSDGGIGAASIWIALYNLLEQYDETVTNSRKEIDITHEMRSLDVFKTVNDLRKQRAKMVNSFANYSFIYDCIEYYCQNKKELDKLRPEIEIPTEYYLDQETYSIDYVLANSNPTGYQQNIYQNCS